LQAFWHSQAGRQNNEKLVKAVKSKQKLQYENLGKLIAIKSMEKLRLISKSKDKQCFASILALTSRSPEQ